MPGQNRKMITMPDMSETWDKEKFTGYVEVCYGPEQAPEVLALVERWIARGDGAAVYENADLSHPEAGWPQILSYGSSAAQLEPICGVCESPLDIRPDWMPDGHHWVHQGNSEGHEPLYPPARLPDIGGRINWRYQLVATYKEGRS